jgi:DegV family protein with EDD domain
VIVEALDNFTKKEEYIDFYEKVSAGWFPRTAKLNYDAHIQHFTKMAEAGVKEVIHFMISSGLANTIEVTRQAAEEVEKQYPGFKVYPLDPLTATVGQGMLVKVAERCRDEGWKIKDTYKYLMEIRNRVQHCIIPTDLFYLNKGGRMTTIAAGVGTVLNIKPILSFDEAGKLKLMEKVRGTKKAFLRVIDAIGKAPLDEKCNLIVVVHTNNEKGAQELASLIQNKTGVIPEIVMMGPVIGSHVGPGSVSCGWISTNTRTDLIKVFKM